MKKWFAGCGNVKSRPVETINNSGARHVALFIKHVSAWHSINSTENAAVGIISEFSINVVVGGGGGGGGGSTSTQKAVHSDSSSGVDEGVMT